MRVRHYLDEFLNEKVAQILRVFAKMPNSYTGRQMSVVLGMNHQTCMTYLEHLCACDVLWKRVIGRSYLYEMRDNYFTQSVLLPMIKEEDLLYESIKRMLADRFSEFCVAIVIYGSYARLEETKSSDLDVCFILEGKAADFNRYLDEFVEEMAEKYVLTISPYVLSYREFDSKKNLSVIEDIKNEGVWICGDKIGLEARCGK